MVPIPDFDIKTENEITSLVDQILKLNQERSSAKLPSQREQLQRTIEHTERKIDELVYELYGLTEEEIEIIEES